jgi:hypothetical protein
MARAKGEQEVVFFSSKIKYVGIFSFRDFYRFCYDWLTDETILDITEEKYSEKVVGDQKEVDIKWVGKRNVTDYFQYKINIDFRIRKLRDIEIVQGGVKIKTNEGDVEVKIKGSLVRDYKGKFERGASQKFLRGIYEKWIIPSRIEQYENKLITHCDEFLNQAKAWLDLEGRKEV